MSHHYMPTIFHDPHKNPPAPPPTYLMYAPICEGQWTRINKKNSNER